MTDIDKMRFLTRSLLDEDWAPKGIQVPSDGPGLWKLLRSMMNLRPPLPCNEEVLAVQDSLLKGIVEHKGIIRLEDTKDCGGGLHLWQGDVTRLATDGIVNAANSGMLGCFHPGHNCIDNAIHSFAGMQLRLECEQLRKLMPDGEAPTATPWITNAWNLPSKHVIHVVGPIISGRVRRIDEEALAACYTNCLDLGKANDVRSIAFCCISTGVFSYPAEDAARLAISTVRQWLDEAGHEMEVVFNVFKDSDRGIYSRLLG